MDNHQRSANYLIWRRVLLSLTVFSLLYIGAVRPLQSLLIDKIIFPAVSVFALDYEDVQLITNVDEISFVNCVRRIIETEIPYLAFDEIHIEENNTLLHNEFIQKIQMNLNSI